MYERLKKEIAHSEELEGTVASMSKEANKLSVRENKKCLAILIN